MSGVPPNKKRRTGQDSYTSNSVSSTESNESQRRRKKPKQKRNTINNNSLNTTNSTSSINNDSERDCESFSSADFDTSSLNFSNFNSLPIPNLNVNNNNNSNGLSMPTMPNFIANLNNNNNINSNNNQKTKNDKNAQIIKNEFERLSSMNQSINGNYQSSMSVGSHPSNNSYNFNTNNNNNMNVNINSINSINNQIDPSLELAPNLLEFKNHPNYSPKNLKQLKEAELKILQQLQQQPFSDTFNQILTECSDEFGITEQLICEEKVKGDTKCYSQSAFVSKFGESYDRNHAKNIYPQYKMYHDQVNQAEDSFLKMFDHVASTLNTLHRLKIHFKHRRQRLKTTFDRLRAEINERYIPIKGKKPKKGRRGSLPKEAVRHLRKWLFDHFQHPYPTEDEKQQLAKETGITHSQVNYWFINARVRIWRPMIESLQEQEQTGKNP